MHDSEDNSTARELKSILCLKCYKALIGWISGTLVDPYVPCLQCVEPSKKWLAGRGIHV